MINSPRAPEFGRNRKRSLRCDMPSNTRLCKCHRYPGSAPHSACTLVCADLHCTKQQSPGATCSSPNVVAPVNGIRRKHPDPRPSLPILPELENSTTEAIAPQAQSRQQPPHMKRQEILPATEETMAPATEHRSGQLSRKPPLRQCIDCRSLDQDGPTWD